MIQTDLEKKEVTIKEKTAYSVNTQAHPVFPNPTVLEAIVEIYFGTPLLDTTLDPIFDKLQSNFQEYHKDHLFSYQATVGERGMSIIMKNSRN